MSGTNRLMVSEAVEEGKSAAELAKMLMNANEEASKEMSKKETSK